MSWQGHASRRIRVSVLGVGAMGRRHARVFASLGDVFELSGVYDVSASIAREVADAFGASAFGTEGDAIVAADLVVIASPIDAHAGAARRALAGGRHVFVEKPLCATATQAFALAKAAGKGQRVFVGHSERFNPVVRALHRLVRPGDVRTLKLRRTSVALGRGPEHGALVSLGVHDLDLVAHLTASPASLRDVVQMDDDRADLVLAAARGAVAWVHVDRRAKARERTLEVTTTAGLFEGDLLAHTLLFRPFEDTIRATCELPTEEPLVAQARSVARALQGFDEPVATALDGARAVALVAEASRWTRSREAEAAATR